MRVCLGLGLALIFFFLDRRVSVLTSAKMEFGLIPTEHWYQPDWIDEERATKARDQMVAEDVIYGGEKCLIFGYLGLSSWPPVSYDNADISPSRQRVVGSVFLLDRRTVDVLIGTAICVASTRVSFSSTRFCSLTDGIGG